MNFHLRNLVRFMPLLGLIVLVFGLPGCRQEVTGQGLTVSGKVSLDGEPVMRGSLSLVPQPGVNGPSGGAPIENGTFTIPTIQNLQPGDYRIEVTVIPRRPEGAGPVTATASPTDSNMRMDKWGAANPPRTFHPSQIVTLKAGDNSYDVDLKK